MIEQLPSASEPTHRDFDLNTELETCVRRNPGSSLLCAFAVGLVAAVLIRALRPEPKPQHRLQAMLEELQERLHDFSAPVMERAGSIAADGMGKVRDRAHQGEAELERVLHRATRRLRRLWS